MPESYEPMTIFVLAPGAFFVLAVLTAIQNKIKINGTKKGKDMSKIQSGCGHDCLSCSDSSCSSFVKTENQTATNSEKNITEDKSQSTVSASKPNTVIEFVNLDNEIADTVEFSEEDIKAINAAANEKEVKEND